MGLAPYGKPVYLDQMRKILKLKADGGFELNLNYFRHHPENIYIITFFVLIGFFIVYLCKVKILPIVNSAKYISIICDIIFITFITSMVIIFFRSTNQF